MHWGLDTKTTTLEGRALNIQGLKMKTCLRLGIVTGTTSKMRKMISKATIRIAQSTWGLVMRIWRALIAKGGSTARSTVVNQRCRDRYTTI